MYSAGAQLLQTRANYQQRAGSLDARETSLVALLPGFDDLGDALAPRTPMSAIDSMTMSAILRQLARSHRPIGYHSR